MLIDNAISGIHGFSVRLLATSFLGGIKMRKTVFLVLLAGFVFSMANPGNATAQLECSDPDLIALVFSNEDINFNPLAYQPYDVQVRVLNPSAPSGQFSAFDFNLILPPNQILMGIQLPPGAINIGAEGDFIVGLADCEPMVDNHFLLATITLFPMDELQGDFFLQPASFPSIPGEMSYIDCDGPPLIVMEPISGDLQFPVARVHGPPLDYCDPLLNLDMMVHVAFEGDFDNLAGTSLGATDGYDLEYDLLDPDTTLTFPHPEWNNPYDFYKHDVKASYDPTEEMKQWTFVTTTSNPQSGGSMVSVTFNPSFATPTPFDFKLRDQTTGIITDLNFTQTYTFYAPPGNSQNTFYLMIGTESEPGGFYVDVNAATGDYSDLGNRAGVNNAATDGYDPPFDIPEPGPPPANYVTASYYQPSWPLGPRFTSDIRAVYNPLTDAKTWPLMIETDQSGSVNLSFDPSFTEADNIELHLKDMQTGQEFDLFPGLSYVFTAGGSGVFHFQLIVGAGMPPELDPTFRYLNMGWSMIGIPLVPPPGQNTLEQVILYQAPGYAYLFEYLGPSGYAILDGADPATTGRGYWIATDNGFSWSMNGERALSGVEIPLLQGWNMIGNPLWFPAPFEGMYVRYNGMDFPWEDAIDMFLVSMGVLSYDNQVDDYSNAVDLRPWNGYWVNALVDGASLWFDWPNFQVLPARLSTPKLDIPLPDSVWETRITMVDANQSHKSIVMGVNPEATSGFDPQFDMPQPPSSPNGGPRLAFVRPEWELAAGDYFSRDIRHDVRGSVAWNAVIMTDNPGRVVLSWVKTPWPEDVDFQIYLPEENRVVVMSMRDQTNVHLEVGNQPVPIVIRTPDMISAVEDMPGMNFEVGVHPNPFNPTTTIHFDLPRPAVAEIRIYSVRGELYGILGGETYQAGRQEVIWTGRDRHGRNAASGSYFAKLYVDGQAIGSVTKMSLVR